MNILSIDRFRNSVQLCTRLVIAEIENLRTRHESLVKPKKQMCVQVFRPYLSFYPDPKHFIVNCEQNIVKDAEKLGEM